MAITESARQLVSGLYIVDFKLPQEEVPKAIEFFQREPSCQKLDIVLRPNNLLLVFEISNYTSGEVSKLYSIIAEKLPVYRVPTYEHGDGLDGRLKSITSYAGLGGSFSWIKVRCPRTAAEKVRSSIQADIRIGPTFWGYKHVASWLYSRVRIPEQSASRQLQEMYTQLAGDNSFHYLQVIQELKGD